MDKSSIQDYMFHPTLQQEAEGYCWKDFVDPWMLELVEILNDMPGVATIASCAGGGPASKAQSIETHGLQPYVFFKCEDIKSLEKLVEAMDKEDNSKNVMMTLHNHFQLGPSIDIRFNEVETMRAYTRKLKETM